MTEEKKAEVKITEKIPVPVRREEKNAEEWIPKTELGKKVKNGEIASLSEVFDSNTPILEPQIVDRLVSELKEKVVEFTKTAKVRRAGRQFAFRAAVLIGDGNEFIGLGTAKDKEKWPAVRKAGKRARLNIIRIKRGCGSWECTCGTGHSVPFQVNGKSASVRVTLLPAPKGTGLVVGDNIKDVLEFSGIRDVWSKTRGSTGTKLNFVTATIDALSKTTKFKASKDFEKKMEKESK